MQNRKFKNIDQNVKIAITRLQETLNPEHQSSQYNLDLQDTHVHIARKGGYREYRIQGHNDLKIIKII